MADRYVKGQLLGKGSFGAAYLVTCKADGQKYVLKEIDISRMQRSEREAAEQEAKVSYPSSSGEQSPCSNSLQGCLRAGVASFASSQRGQLQRSFCVRRKTLHPDGLLL